MSSNSREEREKLKNEYKEHFRKMRAAKERFKRSRHKRNIVDALKDMDSSDLMASFDAFLADVESKVARAEARLDVALESIEFEPETGHESVENNPNRQHDAREALKQIKHEMGLLHREL